MTTKTHLATDVADAEFHDWTRWLGEQLAAGQVSPVEHHLGALAREGRRLQVAAASCDVLIDPTQADVARARAFAKVVSAITAARSAPDTAAQGSQRAMSCSILGEMFLAVQGAITLGAANAGGRATAR
jgi:hypothetical protein